MPSDATTETDQTGTGAPPGRATAAVPGQRRPVPGETSSPRSGPFTGLVTALRTNTAPRPVVPRPQHPPTGARLAGVCGWAAVLALAGIVVGIRGGVALLAGHAPHWYLPGLLIAGGVGIALTSCAFLTVRQHRIPWVFLGGGTAALITSAVFTGTAT